VRITKSQLALSSIAVLETMLGNNYAMVCPRRMDLESRW
jgi:hypothetical protein